MKKFIKIACLTINLIQTQELCQTDPGGTQFCCTGTGFNSCTVNDCENLCNVGNIGQACDSTLCSSCTVEYNQHGPRCKFSPISNPITITYSFGNQLLGKLQNFFYNSMLNLCPMHSCRLGQPDNCGVNLPGDSTYIIKDTSQSLKIKNSPGAWNENFCFSCKYLMRDGIYHTINWSNQAVSQQWNSEQCQTRYSQKDFGKIITYQYNGAASPTIVNPNGQNDFFEGDTLNCPITSCQRQAFDACGQPLTVQLTTTFDTSSYEISAPTNVAAGYEDSFCFQCTFYLYSKPTNVNYDIFKIIQLPQGQTGQDCSTALTSKSFGTKYLKYDAITISTDIGNGYKSFFNHDPTYCQVDSCELLTPNNCASPLSSPQITISNTYPWQITALTNVVEGYWERFCLRCTFNGGLNTIQIAQIQVFQEGAVDCLNQLAPADNPIGDVVVDYDSTTTGMVAATLGYTSFFKNLDELNCPITSCSLLDSSCNINYKGDSTKLKIIGSIDPFQIFAVRNYEQGFSVTVCVKCRVGIDSRFWIQTMSPWTYTQRPIGWIRTTFADQTLTYSPLAGTTQVFAITDFFTKQYPESPLFVSCSLYQPGTTTTYSPQGVSLDPTTFSITAPLDKPLGYSDTFNLQCTDAIGNIFNFDPWTVTIIGPDCTGILLAASSVKPDITVNYDFSQTTLQDVTIGYSDFFQTSDSVNCPIIQCELYDSTCSTLHSAVSQLYMQASYPWVIQAVKNHQPGYSFSLCIKCFAPDNTEIVTTTPWTFTQNPDCQFGWVSTSFGNQNLAYSSSGIPRIFQITDFFTKQSPSCTDLTQCWIVNQGSNAPYDVSQAYSPANIQFDSVTFVTSAQSNVLSGYYETFGYMCMDAQNNYFTYDPWTITQTALDCSTSLVPSNTILPNVIVQYDSAVVTLVDQTQGYTDFFQSTNADCPIILCELFESGCLQAYSGSSNLQMESVNPWKISSFVNVPSGYQVQICQKCSSHNSASITQEWTFEQVKDCSSFLTPNNYANQQFNFMDSSNILTVSARYTDFFSLVDPIVCPISTCEILNSDCLSPYTGSHLTITSNPWAITILQNVLMGFSETVCYRCTLLQGIKLGQVWQVSQNQIDCTSYLSLVQIPLADLIVNHDSTSTGLIQVTQGFTDFFKTSDPNKCPISQCFLLDSDCMTPFSGNSSKLQMSSVFPFKISAIRNDQNSFTYSVCLKCSTPYTGEIVSSPWTYTQNKALVMQNNQSQQSNTTATVFSDPALMQQISNAQQEQQSTLSLDEILEILGLQDIQDGESELLLKNPIVHVTQLVEITPDLGKQIIKFDERTQKLIVDQSHPEIFEGKYKVKLMVRTLAQELIQEKQIEFSIIISQRQEQYDAQNSTVELDPEKNEEALNTNVSKKYDLSLQIEDNSAIKVYTKVKLESIGYDGVVKLKFEDQLDQKLTNMAILSTLGVDLQVIQNDNIEGQKRDTSIREYELELTEYRLLVAVKFNNISHVSIGGVENPDYLKIVLTDGNMFRFKEKRFYDTESKEYVMIRPTLKLADPMIVKIPRQANMSDPVVQSAQTVGQTIEGAMNSMLVSSFVLNFVISVSLKQILKAIRVMQIVAFLAFVQINYQPVTMIYMKSIHSFTTFKVIPEKFIDSAENFMRQNFLGSQISKRRLEELQQGSLLTNLNSIALGVFGLILLIIVYLLITICKRNKVVKKYRTILSRMLFFKLVHQSLNETSIVLLIPILIQTKMNGDTTSIIILCSFIAYPLLTYAYIKFNKTRIDDNDEDFIARNEVVYGQFKIDRLDKTRMSLAFFLVSHNRKIIYSFLIVYMINMTYFQIQAFLFISSIMIIIIQGNTPYIEKSDNTLETINEIVILIVLYHMILISDFVPNDSYELRDFIGISLICFVTLVVFIFIMNIIITLCRKLYRKLRIFQFERKQKVKEGNSQFITFNAEQAAVRDDLYDQSGKLKLKSNVIINLNVRDKPYLKKKEEIKVNLNQYFYDINRFEESKNNYMRRNQQENALDTIVDIKAVQEEVEFKNQQMPVIFKGNSLLRR